jgi:hypothetical protein
MSKNFGSNKQTGVCEAVCNINIFKPKAAAEKFVATLGSGMIEEIDF